MIRRTRPTLRTARYWRKLSGSAFAAVGVLSVFFGLVAAIFPNLLPRGEGWLVAAVVIVSVGFGAINAWPRRIEVSLRSPSTTLRVMEGDLFLQPGHLVIGMSNTFDTATPQIIARESIQGQFLDRIFNEDSVRLDSELDEALKGVNPTGSIDKDGKQLVFPVGTVATLKSGDRCYFCVAYSEMNESNEARASIQGIWQSLDQLWKAISCHANGGEISMPVIGGGQSRISQFLPAQDSIRLTILSFVLASRRERFSNGLNIIVRPQDFANLDRLELQAFLASLRLS